MCELSIIKETSGEFLCGFFYKKTARIRWVILKCWAGVAEIERWCELRMREARAQTVPVLWYSLSVEASVQKAKPI